MDKPFLATIVLKSGYSIQLTFTKLRWTVVEGHIDTIEWTSPQGYKVLEFINPLDIAMITGDVH